MLFTLYGPSGDVPLPLSTLALQLAVYNLLPTTDQMPLQQRVAEARRLLPVGRAVAVLEPFYKVRA